MVQLVGKFISVILYQLLMTGECLMSDVNLNDQEETFVSTFDCYFG